MNILIIDKTQIEHIEGFVDFINTASNHIGKKDKNNFICPAIPINGGYDANLVNTWNIFVQLCSMKGYNTFMITNILNL